MKDNVASGQPAPDIKTKTLPYAWIITGVVVVAIAIAGWWLLQPKAQAVAAAPSGILATAPPPANQKLLNADGAPRSD